VAAVPSLAIFEDRIRVSIGLTTSASIGTTTTTIVRRREGSKRYYSSTADDVNDEAAACCQKSGHHHDVVCCLPTDAVNSRQKYFPLSKKLFLKKTKKGGMATDVRGQWAGGHFIFWDVLDHLGLTPYLHSITLLIIMGLMAGIIKLV
jgi:hypothetical protein